MLATASPNRLFSGFLLPLAAVLLATARIVYGDEARPDAQGRIDELPAAWGDLDTWSRYVPASDETEIGLGLKTVGTQTSMLVGFSARLKGRTPSQPPGEVLVHASAGVLSNAGRARSNTLKFMLPTSAAPASGRTVRTVPVNHTVLDLSSRLGADDQTPGARMNFATAKLAPAEFLRIVKCGQPTATVLGVDVTFRPDQLQAIRAFANQILLKVQ
ncbi:MAG TPA: hypothetical protein VES67_23440 [Vicinamibacterales bacterium]|nr:hypothetical protein [Vicinamibacterales bacterium]